MDPSEFTIQSFVSFEAAEQDQLQYWRSRTPEERISAAELLRQAQYGYDATTVSFQRVFEFVERP